MSRAERVVLLEHGKSVSGVSIAHYKNQNRLYAISFCCASWISTNMKLDWICMNCESALFMQPRRVTDPLASTYRLNTGEWRNQFEGSYSIEEWISRWTCIDESLINVEISYE